MPLTTQMRVFLAGIMQGSRQDRDVHGQDYREALKRVFAAHLPEMDVYCPMENHPESLDYADDEGRGVFLRHVEMAAEMDVLVAYLPEASLGTAVEMWEAHKHGRAVVTISPMTHNWAVKFLSTAVYPDLAAFEEAAASGALRRAIEAARNASD